MLMVLWEDVLLRQERPNSFVRTLVPPPSRLRVTVSAFFSISGCWAQITCWTVIWLYKKKRKFKSRGHTNVDAFVLQFQNEQKTKLSQRLTQKQSSARTHDNQATKSADTISVLKANGEKLYFRTERQTLFTRNFTWLYTNVNPQT